MKRPPAFGFFLSISALSGVAFGAGAFAMLHQQWWLASALLVVGVLFGFGARAISILEIEERTS